MRIDEEDVTGSFGTAGNEPAVFKRALEGLEIYAAKP